MIPLLAGAAIVGGLLWVVKGGAILLGYGQPEYAFEIAPLLFALVTLGLTRWLPRNRARRVATVLAVTAVSACLVAAVSSVVAGHVLGPDLGIGVLAVTAALVVLGLRLRGRDVAVGGLSLLLGVGTLPAVIVGGALSAIDERLLEVPIVVIGVVWITLGVALLQLRRQIPTEAARGRRRQDP